MQSAPPRPNMTLLNTPKIEVLRSKSKSDAMFERENCSDQFISNPRKAQKKQRS